MAQTSPTDPIPVYRIDLSRPPETRYDEVARDFGPRMRSLQGLFDELLTFFLPIAILRHIIAGLAKLLLRRVYDKEEMKELKGIAATTGIKIYLLVALNNLLDCLLGCTSGAALVKPSKGRRKDGDLGSYEPRLMHFRTLDWAMDGLRDILVVLEYVNSEVSGSKVLARSVTYAGFVGTLTAVRPDLSLSLNFRPKHACSKWTLRRHQLMVLLGYRRSIGSTLRLTILDSLAGTPDGDAKPKLETHAKRLAMVQSAPCYLVVCDGTEVAVIEKDFETGKIRISRDFMVHTNHDIDDSTVEKPKGYTDSSTLVHEVWLEESTFRRDNFEAKWKRHQQKCLTKCLHDDGGTTSSLNRPGGGEELSATYPVDESTLKRWVRSRTAMVECTHFACIMDPASGQIRWIQRGPIAEQEPTQEQEQP